MDSHSIDDWKMSTKVIPYAPTSALLVVVVWLVVSTLRTYLQLRHVPGPFLARFTNLWLAVKMWRGESFADIAPVLDERYGPVVRIGPKTVIFSDANAIPTIYATTNVWRKASTYEPARIVMNGKVQDSFVTTRQEDRVSAIKKHINSAFTFGAISDYEPHVDETVRLMNERVRSHAPTVDLVRWFKLFAFEGICRIAFSDGDFPEQEVQTTLVALKERFNHWQRWLMYPEIEALLYKNPLVRGRMGPSLLTQRAMQRVRERETMLESGAGQVKYADLLDRYMQANKKAPDTFGMATVVGLVMSTIHAGAESTASTLAITTHYLLQHPAAMAELIKELEDAQLASPPSFKSVAKLPYLEAVIKESMRVYNISVFTLDREVPAGGAHVAGVFVPGGTTVAISMMGLARREELWGPEPADFRPERWLEGDSARRNRMERAFMGFGQGKRMCIGQHIAWIEMKKVLPELLLNYEFELIRPKGKLEFYTAIVAFPKELIVKVTPRKRDVHCL
ncbi:uncharacterized protein Z520_00768 [Fonsecaea multimorphosa CBS 102226]|uniref:Cytochrome P450 monooxygenase n=1 Tax=Fonsecaea multimorphosa CBS 102226 TaxID=1442371 RepID=A0A0D2HQC0_9EURO|nr:uncharacterized protein Z520_00768 [Fonsecaea multimorphosa CBS 102226]KIY04076.1 hypothetical protein Z520_00768 [Fonsecaea multimorphosa CBS 102226]